MIKQALAFTVTLLICNPLMANEVASCGHAASPLTSVADFDANGIVNGKDISILANHLGNKKPYFSLYDRNGDGLVDDTDIELATKDINKNSSQSDQEIANKYNSFKYLQTVRGYEELASLGYFPIPVALKGHGVHWFNMAGMASMMGQKQPNPLIAEGLNVSTDEKRIHALFYATPAEVVFDNGATDYPYGEVWKDGRVISFKNEPMKMTSRPDEMWHKHGGLCMPLNYVYDQNGNKSLTGEAHQYMTYNECQALPSDESMLPDGTNLWTNFWMVHLWLYDLNPNGLFAGTHPCVEPNGPSAETINGDREVPAFFEGHGEG